MSRILNKRKTMLLKRCILWYNTMAVDTVDCTNDPIVHELDKNEGEGGRGGIE